MLLCPYRSPSTATIFDRIQLIEYEMSPSIVRSSSIQSSSVQAKPHSRVSNDIDDNKIPKNLNRFVHINCSATINSLLWWASTVLQILIFTTPPLDFRIVYLITHLSLIASRSEICWDKFDVNYRNQCLNGHWKQRYYFDHASLTCRQFWYDGCRSDSRNMFEDLLTCQWLCESQPMYKSRACLQDFDSHYKDQCSGGRWRQQYYFDKNAKRCIPFWYDGCTGESENIFQDESSCLHTCENPAKNDPYQQRHTEQRNKMKETLAEVNKPNLTDICAVSNPCRNNSICVFVWKKNTYYCKCEDGYTGQNCTEKIDSDPCATHPCKNGATCLAKVQKGKTTFECYCTIGYGGPHCDQRPCDVNPCLHNGTCRTTAGLSSYFCECREGFGGKNCDITIGSKLPEERYGSNVLLVSSGKAEWIQEMKKRLGGQKKTTPPSIADEPYKETGAKKLGREEREKQDAESRGKEEKKTDAELSYTKNHETAISDGNNDVTQLSDKEPLKKSKIPPTSFSSSNNFLPIPLLCLIVYHFFDKYRQLP